jgi:hypothetical protein
MSTSGRSSDRAAESIAIAPALQAFSRRRLLRFLATGLTFAGALLVARPGFTRCHAVGLVLKNGWILRADDVDRLA